MLYLTTSVAVIAAVPLVLFVTIGLFAWHVPASPPIGPRSRRVLVLVPAHNESAVIGRLLESLSAQEYDSRWLELHVVADRCSDSTALVAGRFAHVHERSEGLESKGAALAWLLDRVEVGAEDIIVILDADNYVGEGFIGSIVDGFDQGDRVVQVYLEPANPDVSHVALAGAISAWLSNRLIDLPRRNIGMSASLAGTGFAVRGDLVAGLDNGRNSVVEDQMLTDRLVLEGERIVWMHHVRACDEKPTSIKVLANQRARWVSGEGDRRVESVRKLVMGNGRWNLSRGDRLARLVLPGRTVSAAVLAVLGGAAYVWPDVLPFSPHLISALFITLGVEVVAALLVEGVGIRRIVRLPLLAIFAILWIPERMISRTKTGWYHTPHGESTDG